MDVVPAGFNVRTSVHEYGGGAYCIHDGVAYVSGFDDQRLYRVDPGGEPVPITPDVPERRHRYADGRVTPDGSLWIGVRERHAASDSASDVVNELVAVPTDGASEPRVVAEGRDFYSNPRISPDGSRLCFLAWNLPWMPWDGCELYVADLAPDGEADERRARCGGGWRGVDLAARVESRRRPRVRERQVRLVEPRADPRRRAGAAPCRGRRVRLSRMGVRGTVVRLPRRRSHRVRVRERPVHQVRRARTGVRRARAARRRPRLLEVAVRLDRRDETS